MTTNRYRWGHTNFWTIAHLLLNNNHSLIIFVVTSVGEREYVSNSNKTSDELLFSYVIEQTNYIQWNEDDDNDDVRFVLDQRAELDLYKTSLLKQQSADRNESPKDLHPDILSFYIKTLKAK
jgi:hypothetical protein